MQELVNTLAAVAQGKAAAQGEGILSRIPTAPEFRQHVTDRFKAAFQRLQAQEQAKDAQEEEEILHGKPGGVGFQGAPIPVARTPSMRSPATATAAATSIPTARRAPARNAPCPCGSGKKFKHCHIGRLGDALALRDNVQAILRRDGPAAAARAYIMMDAYQSAAMPLPTPSPTQEDATQ